MIIIPLLIVVTIVIYAIAFGFSFCEMIDKDVKPFIAAFLSFIPIFNIIYLFVFCVDLKKETEKIFKKK